MSLHSQPLLDMHHAIIVDLFAGGGGASSGIEEATGRMVDIAVNHSKTAVELHRANHPQTAHYHCDVFEVDPRMVTQGRRVGLLWASPDCTYHSKARGGKPIREANKKRRALAWVVTRWANQVGPDVIMLENVEEFAQWGPLVGSREALKPCHKRRGKTFRRWVWELRNAGYKVEWREMRACDHGAATIRKRLFVIARRDGQPIVWPEATHGPSRSKPFDVTANHIDWSRPMCSIFATKEEARAWGQEHGQAAPIRPLAEKTLARIARGVKRFVIDNPKPFLVNIAFGDNGRWGSGCRSTEEPLNTITTKGDAAIVAPFTVPRYGEREGQQPRCGRLDEPGPVIVPTGNGQQVVAPFVAGVGGRQGQSPERSADQPFQTITAKADSVIVAANLIGYHDDTGATARVAGLQAPIPTIDCANRFGVVASFLGQFNGGFATGNTGDGKPIDEPMTTIACKGPHQAVISAFCNVNRNNGTSGYALDEPGHTLTAIGAYHNVVAAHIKRDFGTSTGHAIDEPLATITSDGGGKASIVASFMLKYYGEGTGQQLSEPLDTITTRDRFALITTKSGAVIYDIAMRMLTPRELYSCQGFRPTYIIDRTADGTPISKTEQVRMVGNSVCPPLARALVAANCEHLIARPRKELMA